MAIRSNRELREGVRQRILAVSSEKKQIPVSFVGFVVEEELW